MAKFQLRPPPPRLTAWIYNQLRLCSSTSTPSPQPQPQLQPAQPQVQQVPAPIPIQIQIPIPHIIPPAKATGNYTPLRHTQRLLASTASPYYLNTPLKISPTIASIFNRLFHALSGTRNMVSEAAKTKVEKIIDENHVGT